MSEAFALEAETGDDDSPLTRLCKAREAFETPEWAARAIVRHELMTPRVIDPCVGLGMLSRCAAETGHIVWSLDIEDWSYHFGGVLRADYMRDWLCIRDLQDPETGFGTFGKQFEEWTCFMNPPFSLACAFVDKAFALGARKVLCFQRFAWRESQTRRAWFEANPPARIWLCGARATTWRFDEPRRGDPKASGTPTAHAWFVWERGHRGIEATHMLWPERDDGQEVLL